MSKINNRLTEKASDVDIMGTFQNTYFNGNESSRRLAVHFIKLGSDPEIKKNIREFIVWDILERNMKGKFRFDEELSDWHCLGDVIFDMGEEDPDSGNKFWCNLKKTALSRWGRHRKELTNMFTWIKNIYQQDKYWASCEKNDG